LFLPLTTQPIKGGTTLGSKTQLNRIRKIRFKLMSTHVKIVTSKSYMDAYVAKEVILKVANLIATFEYTKILDFF
jgi:hypothetical protein